nr:hypothetical protein BaRGS_035055 [Batillaria attramentaria]
MEDDLLPPSDSEDEDDLGLKVFNANRPLQECDVSSEDDEDDGDDSDVEEEKEQDEDTVQKTDGDIVNDSGAAGDADSR